MMVLRKVVITLVIIVGLLWAGGYLLPAEYGLSRTIVVNAPIETVFDQVNDLERWPNWSPWSAMDAEMQVTYGDKRAGKGSSYSWNGPETGIGTLTVTESNPYSRLEMEMDFDGSKAGSDWDFKPVDGGVEVTWGFDAVAGNVIDRYVGNFLIDGFLGPMYEDGLSRLKTYCESAPATDGAMPDEAEEPAAADSIAADTEE